MQLETLCRINLLYIATDFMFVVGSSSGEVSNKREREFMKFLREEGNKPQ